MLKLEDKRREWRARTNFQPLRCIHAIDGVRSFLRWLEMHVINHMRIFDVTDPHTRTETPLIAHVKSFAGGESQTYNWHVYEAQAGVDPSKPRVKHPQFGFLQPRIHNQDRPDRYNEASKRIAEAIDTGKIACHPAREAS